VVDRLVTDGMALWLALGFLALESLALVIMGARRGASFLIAGFCNIAAGGLLIVAVFAAVAGQSMTQVGVLLIMAGMAHFSDVIARWRAGSTTGPANRNS